MRFINETESLMKQISFILFIALWHHSCAFGQQDKQAIERYDTIYKTVGNHKLVVNIFNPEVKEEKSLPAMAFFHGGGWVYGSPSEFHAVCTRYALKGFKTFSFQYRLSIMEDGTHPNPDISPIESVKDARSAIRWLKENSEELGIDPSRIVVVGQSAGGQLTLSTTLMDGIDETSDNLNFSPEPAAMILYSSSVNMLEAWGEWHMGERREQIWSISPMHNLNPGMPPVLAFHGEEDCMVPFWVIQRFEKEMHILKNPYRLISFEGRRHYLGEGLGLYADYVDEGILNQTDNFLRELGYLPD